MRRGDLTRAELLGYIGMIPTPGDEKVFVKLPWLSQPAFFEDLEKVKNGKDDHIVIRCTQREFDQFDLKPPLLGQLQVAPAHRRLHLLARFPANP